MVRLGLLVWIGLDFFEICLNFSLKMGLFFRLVFYNSILLW